MNNLGVSRRIHTVIAEHRTTTADFQVRCDDRGLPLAGVAEHL